MIVLSEKDLLNNAISLNANKINWHFHLLTPECIFNTQKRFALVLENSNDNIQYVNYSDQKQEETSKKLLEILHGIKADETTDYKGKEASGAVLRMVNRAKELIEKGIYWHHHALFPKCVFNTNLGQWKIVLEDPETEEIIESVTKEKPEADLQLIEPLFYHQNI